MRYLNHILLFTTLFNITTNIDFKYEIRLMLNIFIFLIYFSFGLLRKTLRKVKRYNGGKIILWIICIKNFVFFSDFNLTFVLSFILSIEILFWFIFEIEFDLPQ